MTMIDPAIVPQRTLYTGAKLPAVGMGTFGSDHADAELFPQQWLAQSV